MVTRQTEGPAGHVDAENVSQCVVIEDVAVSNHKYRTRSDVLLCNAQVMLKQIVSLRPYTLRLCRTLKVHLSLARIIFNFLVFVKDSSADSE